MFEEDFGMWERFISWWTGQLLTAKEKQYISMIGQSLPAPLDQQLSQALGRHLVGVERKDQFTNPRRISTLTLVFDEKFWSETSTKVRQGGRVLAQGSFNVVDDCIPFRLIARPDPKHSRWSLEVRLYYTFARMLEMTSEK